MNKIPNRQAICEVLMKHAETDKDIVVLCSDSRKCFPDTVCKCVSGAVCGDGYRGAGSGQRFCRSCKMRQESICGISGVLPFYKKL